jgi:hypothetical protein
MNRQEVISFIKRWGQQLLTSNFFGGLLVVFISWGMYFTFLWPQMLYFDGKGLQAGWIGVWGDWAAHITYANVFALKPPSMWLSPHPIHVNSPFTYPFVADAISGLLMRAGMNLIDAFILPSIITSLFFLGVVYGLYFSVLKKGSRAVVALSLFLLNGGWGVWWFIKDWLADPSWEIWAYPPEEYTHLYKQYIEWISIVTSEMIPQRAFLLGFPLTLLIIWQLHNWYERNFHNVPAWRVLALGFFSGWLFFIHAHSFMALFAISGVLTLFSWKRWRYWMLYAFATAAVAVPIASLLHGDSLGSFFRFLPGWFANAKHHDMNWFYFWWLNSGLFLPLAVIGTLWKKLYKNPLVLSGWVIFAALNLIQFQPHIWDNTKMVTWAHFFLVIPVWYVLQAIWQGRWWRKAVVVLLFILLTASSWLDWWRFTRVDRNTYQMWSTEDLQMAWELNQISQPGDRVLTGQNHNSWVVSHTHTQALLGFPGWLWTYGVTDPKLSEDINTMFRGGQEAEQLLQQYDVKFVIIGQPERHDLKANEEWFAARYPLVIQGTEYNTYQILDY